MDQILFYGVVAVSLIFGALMYRANMVEEESGLLVDGPIFLQAPWWKRIVEPAPLLAISAAALCVVILRLDPMGW